MAYTARKVDYFYTTVNTPAAEAYQLLAEFAGLGVDFLAFASVPFGPTTTQLTVFPADSTRLQTVARRSGLTLHGPNPAVLVQGDDEIGALARIHERVRQEGIDVYASSGVTDGRGGYGYILYVRPLDADRAARALGG
jgi:hypothetical protein